MHAHRPEAARAFDGHARVSFTERVEEGKSFREKLEKQRGGGMRIARDLNNHN